APGDARRALSQLAHQPQGEPRGQGTDRARAGRHELQQLHRRPVGRERGLSAQLCAPHAQPAARVPFIPQARSAVRMSAVPPSHALLTTPFHVRTAPLVLGQTWRRWAGHAVASCYDWTHEHEYAAIRNAAALIDISPLYKYHIE